MAISSMYFEMASIETPFGGGGFLGAVGLRSPMGSHGPGSGCELMFGCNHQCDGVTECV